MANDSQERIIIEPSGMVYVERIAYTPMPLQSLTSRLMDQQIQLIPALRPDEYVAALGQDGLMYCITLPYMQLSNTPLMLDTESSRPRWVFDYGDPSMPRTLKITMPPEIVIRFMLRINVGRNNIKEMALNTAYLVLQHRETRKAYHPEIPNVYPDCHLCTGRNPVFTAVHANNPLETVIDNLRDAWQQDNVNKDLMNDASFAAMYPIPDEGSDIVVPMDRFTARARQVAPPPMVTSILERLPV